MSKKILITSPENPLDPEEVAAEQHVTEIMGPAWSSDDSSAQTSVPVNVTANAVSSGLPVENEQNTATPGSLAAETTVVSMQRPDDADLDLAPISSPADPNTEEQAAVESSSLEQNSSPTENGVETPKQDALSPVVMKESRFDTFKEAFYRWWDNKLARYMTILVLLAVVGVLVGVPAVRTNTMNALGFRASVSVYAVDATTLQPLSGVSLSVDEATVKTGQEGRAKLTGVKLGKRMVLVRKAGFADIRQQVTFGFRAVDLGELDMEATGLQLGFVITDYLSGKPIADATLESGESSTRSDKHGKAVITLAPNSAEDTISIHKNGYRVEQVKAEEDESEPKPVKLVLAAKEVYITKENGIYNLKKIDLDGKNATLLLAGTGTETASITASVDPLSQYVALVSTRDNLKNKDGYLLNALTLVNISTGDSETIEHAEKLTIVGWSGTTLLYQQIVAGTSAANASREKLMSYNYATNKRYQIASANHFLGAELHSGTVHFAVSSTDPNAKSGLMSVALDGSAKKLIQEGDAWALYRADYKTLKLQTVNKWYVYTFGGSVAETQAATTVTRSYLDSGDAKLSVWSDPAATSGALAVYNIATGKDQVVTKTKGQYKPLRWLNNRVFIYREATKMGATDYVMSMDGGDAVKVVDTHAF